MKILIINLEGTGGMFQYSVLLTNALAEENDVTVVTPMVTDVTIYNRNVRIEKLNIGDTIPNFFRSLIDFRDLLKLYKIIKDSDPDVIHFQNPYNPWMCPLFPLIKKYPKVVAIPEGQLHLGMHRRYEMVISRKIHVDNSDALICLYEHDKQLALSYSGDKPIYIIPHGVNKYFNRYMQPDVEEENLIFFFGGISPFKGIPSLLSAFKIVEEKAPGFKLLIAGKGDLTPYLDVATKPDSIIVDNRFIPEKTVAEYFQRSMVLILPYLERDHSGIIPISLAFEKPVVVSTLVSDALTPYPFGLIVEPDNPEQLAEAILKIIGNKELREEFKRNCRKKIDSELDWKIIMEKTINCYRSVINKND